MALEIRKQREMSGVPRVASRTAADGDDAVGSEIGDLLRMLESDDVAIDPRSHFVGESNHLARATERGDEQGNFRFERDIEVLMLKLIRFLDDDIDAERSLCPRANLVHGESIVLRRAIVERGKCAE